MAQTERTYVVPLRKEWLKAPRYKRTKKAVIGLRKFLQKHMKSEDVKLGKHLNLELWKHGIRNPPSKIKVNVSKDEKGVVKAELFGAPVETTETKTQTKKEETEELAKEKITEQKPAEKQAETKSAPKKTPVKKS